MLKNILIKKCKYCRERPTFIMKEFVVGEKVYVKLQCGCNKYIAVETFANMREIKKTLVSDWNVLVRKVKI